MNSSLHICSIRYVPMTHSHSSHAHICLFTHISPFIHNSQFYQIFVFIFIHSFIHSYIHTYIHLFILYIYIFSYRYVISCSIKTTNLIEIGHKTITSYVRRLTLYPIIFFLCNIPGVYFRIDLNVHPNKEYDIW